jgi:hypothetical protein
MDFWEPFQHLAVCFSFHSSLKATKMAAGSTTTIILSGLYITTANVGWAGTCKCLGVWRQERLVMPPNVFAGGEGGGAIEPPLKVWIWAVRQKHIIIALVYLTASQHITILLMFSYMVTAYQSWFFWGMSWREQYSLQQWPHTSATLPIPGELGWLTSVLVSL